LGSTTKRSAKDAKGNGRDLGSTTRRNGNGAKRNRGLREKKGSTMRTDCHIHVRGGKCEAGPILEQMDRLKIDKMVLMGSGAAKTPAAQKKSDDELSKLCSADRRRLVGFARIEPQLAGTTDEIRRCREKLGLVGIKMLPDHWAPCDEFMHPVYKTIEAMGMPIIFHSGILWGNADSSRFCRPANYEAVIFFPKLKIALAHIGWPWVDECIAVVDRFVDMAKRDGRKSSQVWIDCTPGTPPVYRKEALRKALAVCGAPVMLYGSDLAVPGDLSIIAGRMETDIRLLRELGCKQEEIDMVLGSNLDRFLEAE